jgi:hypothetical protein
VTPNIHRALSVISKERAEKILDIVNECLGVEGDVDGKLLAERVGSFVDEQIKQGVRGSLTS